MATINLLSLPTELLQRTFEYLDWDHSNELTPSRPDIFNISLTCGHLRLAVLPILFRSVTLKLRWVDDALVEPALFKIRTQCPELAKHIRCVYIKTLFGHFPNPRGEMEPFAVPDRPDLLESTSHLNDGEIRQLHEHQRRVDNVASKLFENPLFSEMVSKVPANLREHVETLTHHLAQSESLQRERASNENDIFEAGSDNASRLGEDTVFDAAREEDAASLSQRVNIQQRLQHRDLRLQLDALYIVMLCLPYTVNSLVFEVLPTDRIDVLQVSFALHVAAMACRIFGDRLQRLHMITRSHLPRLSRRTHVPEPDAQGNGISTEVIAELKALHTLAIASEQERGGRVAQSSGLLKWHALSSTVTKLKLCTMEEDPQALVKLMNGFHQLQALSLSEVGLNMPLNIPQQDPNSILAYWLSFLVELRRKMPKVMFDLESLYCALFPNKLAFLPRSGAQWLLKEAVPQNHEVDFERETRLAEDFESFLPLWSAEDSERGNAAAEARKDGKLVDAAMSSRWRGLKY